MRKLLWNFLLSWSAVLLLIPVALATRVVEQTIDVTELAADTNVYAILYTDGTMVFQHGSTPEKGRKVLETFMVDMVNGYSFTWVDGGSNSMPTTPWRDVLSSIKKVDFADTIHPLSTKFWFYKCANLKKITHIENLDTSNVTSMQCMFYECKSLTSLDLSSFDTSQVIVMGGMFLRCSKLSSLNLSGFDTSKVQNMTAMFHGHNELKTLDLSSFNTSRVVYMDDMFSYADELTTIYTSENFVTANVSNSYKMFFDNTKLVGGNKTTFDSSYTDKTYARIDKAGTPGYFTDASAKPAYSVPKVSEPEPGNAEASRKAGEQRLKKLYQDFETAYTNYMTKVSDILTKKGQEKQNTVSDYEEQARKLMDADKQKHYLSFNLGNSLDTAVDERAKLHAYMAVCQMFNETADAQGLDFSKIGFSDPVSAESKIVNQIRKSLSRYNKTFDYSGSKVEIRCLNAQINKDKNAQFGRITVTEHYVGNTYNDYTVLLCTGASDGGELIAAYLNEMRNLFSNAVTNVYASLVQDLLGKSVSDLTTDLIKKKITGPVAAKLAEHGWDQLANTLYNCYEYYKLCKNCTEITVDGMTFKNMEKNVKKVQEFNFQTPASDSASKKLASKLEQAERDFMSGLYEFYTTGTIADKGIWSSIKRFFSGKCPIAIEVLDASGKQIGYVGDDDLRYDEEQLWIEENGDEKRIYFFTDDPVSLRITGTDYGTMDCTLEEYDNGTPTGRANFYDIPLEAGKEFSAPLIPSGGTVDAEELRLTVEVGSGGTIAATEYIPSFASAAVQIRAAVAPDGGGTVTGGGVYVKGDAAVLCASADENHTFIGWYDEEETYLSGDSAYTFTAREDKTVTVYFAENYPSLVNYMVEVSGQYRDVYNVVVEQDRDAFTVHVTKLEDTAAGQNLCVFLADYEDSGKMAALSEIPGVETAAGLDFSGTVSERGSKLFMLDQNFRPVIRAYTSE